MKLYKVTLRGLSSITSTNYQTSYVVAPNPNAAYLRVRRYCDDRDIGFRDEREVKSIELIADSADYPSCRTKLFLGGLKKK